MSVDAVAILVRLGEVVSADRHQPAIPDLEFTMKLSQALVLPAILGAKPSTAKDEYHRIGSLQFRELSTFQVAGFGGANRWSRGASNRAPRYAFTSPNL